MVTQFIIPVNPKTKKNSQQIIYNRKKKRHMIIQNQSYLSYEQICSEYIPQLHIDYPVNIKAVYYRATKHRVDLTNLHEALHDILIKYGCIVDDNYKIVHSTDGSYVDFDKENPRTEITITRIGEE